MSIAEEIEKLQALHGQGALTDDEFAQTKATLLARFSDEPPAAGVDALNEAVERLRLRTEITQLDLDWERERESHMIRGRYGARYLPSAERGVIQAIAMVGFGIYMMFVGPSIGVTGVFLMLGLGFIIIGVLVGVTSFKKTSAYKAAEQRYKERRRELAAGQSSGSREL